LHREVFVLYLDKVAIKMHASVTPSEFRWLRLLPLFGCDSQSEAASHQQQLLQHPPHHHQQQQQHVRASCPHASSRICTSGVNSMVKALHKQHRPQLAALTKKLAALSPTGTTTTPSASNSANTSTTLAKNPAAST
jgi:hypothetical protein